MKKCGNCKKELENDDLFCPYCGKKVEAEAKTKEKVVEEKKEVIEKPKETSSTGTKSSTNGLALSGFIVSLVSTLLCCGSFNVVSLILSIVGLVQSKDYKGDGGKGFAIAGIVISAIPIVIWILFYLFAMVTRTGYVTTDFFEI